MAKQSDNREEEIAKLRAEIAELTAQRAKLVEANKAMTQSDKYISPVIDKGCPID